MFHDLGGSRADFREGGVELILEEAVFGNVMIEAVDVVAVAVGSGVVVRVAGGVTRAEGNVLDGGFRVAEELSDFDGEGLVFGVVRAIPERYPGAHSIAQFLGGVGSFADKNIVSKMLRRGRWERNLLDERKEPEIGDDSLEITQSDRSKGKILLRSRLESDEDANNFGDDLEIAAWSLIGLTIKEETLQLAGFFRGLMVI